MTLPVMVVSPDDYCGGCGAEFIAGANFCHACGYARNEDKDDFPSFWLSPHQRLGLPLLTFLALAVGAVCLIVAFALGNIVHPSSLTASDVPVERIEWMVAAIAFFIGGILLKTDRSKE